MTTEINENSTPEQLLAEITRLTKENAQLVNRNDDAVEALAEERAERKYAQKVARDEAVRLDREEQARPRIPQRPRNWEQWSRLSDAEKAECISLFDGCLDECLRDRQRVEEQNRQAEVQKKLASIRPVLQR